MRRLMTCQLLLLLCLPAMAAVRLTPIYANEASNWPLETFAANGLFRQIARYQHGHPKAVVLDGGDYTLQRLADELPATVLSRNATGWVLHYPLVIGPGTRLSLSDEKLFIAGQHGGCLINRGELALERARISSNGDNSSGFIHGWGGSTTHIADSALSGLGRADYRANGVSVARHRYQGQTPPARLTIVNSRFANLYRGVDAQAGSEVTIQGLTVTDSRNQGLVLDNSPARIERLRVSHANGHGIRASGQGRLVMRHSELRHNRGAGLLVEDHTATVEVDRLVSQHNREYGIQLKGDRQPTATLTQLTLTDNGADGLRLDGTMTLSVAQATISRNQRYAIAIQSGQSGEVHAAMTALTLHHNRLAALHTRGEGELDLVDISLRHGSNRGQYLSGNLAPRESQLLPPLLKGKRVAIAFTERPTAPLASLR